MWRRLDGTLTRATSYPGAACDMPPLLGAGWIDALEAAPEQAAHSEWFVFALATAVRQRLSEAEAMPGCDASVSRSHGVGREAV